VSGIAGEAVISRDGLYRYRLERTWSTGPTITWIMLNPSTADATHDDATIKRIVGFSRSWRFGTARVVNLYAYRATDPRQLWQAADPVGPDNDRHLTEALTGVEALAAWGVNARPERVQAVLALHAAAPGAGRLHALATTKAGAPRHPLYLPGSLVPAPWQAVAARPSSDSRAPIRSHGGGKRS
jgi:hypothetical protein